MRIPRNQQGTTRRLGSSACSCQVQAIKKDNQGYICFTVRLKKNRLKGLESHFIQKSLVVCHHQFLKYLAHKRQI